MKDNFTTYATFKTSNAFQNTYQQGRLHEKEKKKKGQQYQIIRIANHFPCLNSIFKLKPAQRKQFKPIWYCYLRKEATIILTKIVKI